MSKQSIEAYQRFTGKVPPLEDRLRDLVGKIRRRAAADLAMSNDLEAMANDLAAPKAPAEPRWLCDCGETLTFDPSSGTGEHTVCFCGRCSERSNHIPGVTFVYGYGRDKATALADWRQRMDSF